MAFGTAITVLPWLAWSALAVGDWQGAELSGYYTNYAGAWSALGFPLLKDVTTLNGVLLFHAALATPLAGAADYLYQAGSTVSLWLVLGGGIVWTGLVPGVARLRLLPTCLAAYGAACLVWPWPPLRFLVPVLPLLLAGGGQRALDVVGRVVPATVLRRTLVALVVVALVANVTLAGKTAAFSRAHHYPYRAIVQPPLHWDSLKASFDWVNARTSPDDVVAAGLDTMVFLYTGRRAMRPFAHQPDRLFYRTAADPLGTADELQDALRSIPASWLLSSPMPDFAEHPHLAALIQNLRLQTPPVLVPRFESGDDRVVVFEVCLTALTRSPSADCEQSPSSRH